MSSQLDIGAGRPLTIRTEAGPIAALESGPVDGVPVLLVPGYTGSKEDFGPLLDPLADAGFHAVTVDLPGQFESPGPDDPARYTPRALAATVRAVAATLGPRAHLLGHSFGGLVSRAAVIDDRAAFASLVLMDSGPAALGGTRAQLIQMLRPYLPSLGLAGVYAASEAAAAAEPGYVPAPPELAAFMQRRFLAGSPDMLLGMGEALISEPDRVEELAATGLALLVLYGENDTSWSPALQAEMATRLAAVRIVVPDAAHSPAVENPPATVDALITFWRAHG
ncbi:MAG: alpha/beta hydrolase [Jatrophihabitantaceae bacterium]